MAVEVNSQMSMIRLYGGYDLLLIAHSLKRLSVYGSCANDHCDLKSGF